MAKSSGGENEESGKPTIREFTKSERAIYQVFMEPKNRELSTFEKAKLCQAHGRTLSLPGVLKILHDPWFQQQILYGARAQVIEAMPAVVHAAIEAAKDGSHQDRKMLLSMSGMLKDARKAPTPGDSPVDTRPPPGVGKDLGTALEAASKLTSDAKESQEDPEKRYGPAIDVDEFEFKTVGEC